MHQKLHNLSTTTTNLSHVGADIEILPYLSQKIRMIDGKSEICCAERALTNQAEVTNISQKRNDQKNSNYHAT